MKFRKGDDDAVVCRLKEIRTQKGLTQAHLAEAAGIKRQAVYDIESGKYLPNTAVALKLAKSLNCRVEDIFYETSPEKDPQVTLVADNQSGKGTSLTLVKVRDKLLGYPLENGISAGQGIQAADGLLSSCGEKARLLCDRKYLDKTVLLPGCDPAFSLLASYVMRMPGEERLLWRFASSYRALTYLASGQAHIAGIHLHNTGSGESNADAARKILSCSGRLIGFTVFEEGLMVAPGNPLNIRGIEDLGRKDVRLANREPGAALRILLDDCLERAGIPAEAVRGYHNRVGSHLEGAQQVMFKRADAALGLRAVSLSCCLDFVPLTAVRCDLVIPEDMFDLSAVQVMMDVLQSKSFRHELAVLPGYETGCTGKVIAEI